MIFHITLKEGGKWIQFNSNDLLESDINVIKKHAKAIRYGKWIYDFVLEKLGYNPVRLYISK